MKPVLIIVAITALLCGVSDAAENSILIPTHRLLLLCCVAAGLQARATNNESKTK